LLPLALAALEPDWLRAEAAAACGTEPSQLEWWLARVRLDVAIFGVYGLSLPEVAYVLSTFPLLDRQQPALSDEGHSTITRDLLLMETAAQFGQEDGELGDVFRGIGIRPRGSIGRARERANTALGLGALPYVVEPKADYFTEWADDEEEEAFEE
jgi:hypothetical protein